MKYDATEEELQMIGHGKVNQSASSGYIICTNTGINHYLTMYGK